MYPVLTVDGKELNITDISYSVPGVINSVGVFEGHNYMTYYDESANVYTEGKLKINIKESLKWVDRYKEALEDIEQVIDEKADLMTTLAHEQMQLNRNLPFVDKKKENEYFQKEREMIGLLHAQEIIENLID